MAKWFEMQGSVEKIEEFNRIALKTVHPTRVWDSWVLEFVIKGNRTVRLEQDEIFAKQGDFILLPPGIPHYGMQVDEHDVVYIHFKMSGEESFYNEEFDSGRIVLPATGKFPKEPDVIAQIIFLLNEWEVGYISSSFFNLQLTAILSQISLYIQKERKWRDAHEKLSDKILGYISSNYMNNLTRKDFESQFQMSYKQLNNIFSERQKMTILKRVTEYRIRQSCTFLLAGCTIEEAATLVGYTDYFYFLRVFKKITGVTPKEYLRRFLLSD